MFKSIQRSFTNIHTTRWYSRIPRTYQTSYQNIHRYKFAANAVSQLRSIDMLPEYEIKPEEANEAFTDSKATLFSTLFEKAKRFDPESPMLRLNSFGQESVVLFSHDLVKQFQQYELYGQTKRTVPPPFVKVLGRFFVELYGKEHLDWRKKIAKSFKPDTIDQYAPFIHESANKLVLNGIFNASKSNDSFIHFYPLCRQFAFEVGMKFVWGPLLNNDELEKAYKIFTGVINGLTPASIGADPDGTDPDSDYSKAMRFREELQHFLLPYYNEAEELTKNNGWNDKYINNTECLIKGIMENDAIYDDGSYTIFDKVDQMMLLAFAAYETSAASLNTLIYNIWKYPQQTEVVRNAIMNDDELSDPNTVLTLSVLNKCEELDQFIKESQRRYNLVPVFMRQVHTSKGLQFGRYSLPDKTAITIPISWLHKGNGSWSDNPLEFDPSRFDKSNGRNKEERGDIGRYNNIPFAFGLHKCLGMHLSLLEMKMYTTLLLRDWEFQLDETKLVDDDNAINTDPNIGFPHYNVHLKLLKQSK